MSRESEGPGGNPRRPSKPANGGEAAPGRGGPDELAAGSDADQTMADSDQTAADTDQSFSDADRSQSDSDQRASDRDQAAADRDIKESGTGEMARVHASSQADRERGTLERDRASLSRLRVASERDEQASVRDRNSAQRDQHAEARDRATERMERHAEELARKTEEINPELQEAMEAAARARAAAADNRDRAAEDRGRAAVDRRQAAEDRRQASVDLERAHLDALTGAYQRGMGEIVLGHEVARAHRAERPLVLAFIDVDGLKAVNDSNGHAAGDEVLKEVATAVQAKLRSYDPLVRVGGDEFVCALADADLDSAANRFTEVRTLLATASITVGLTEMRPEDSVTDMIQRSNADMRRLRAESSTSPPSAATRQARAG